MSSGTPDQVRAAEKRAAAARAAAGEADVPEVEVVEARRTPPKGRRSKADETA